MDFPENADLSNDLVSAISDPVDSTSAPVEHDHLPRLPRIYVGGRRGGRQKKILSWLGLDVTGKPLDALTEWYDCDHTTFLIDSRLYKLVPFGDSSPAYQEPDSQLLDDVALVYWQAYQSEEQA